MDRDWDALMKEHEQLLSDRLQARVNNDMIWLREIEARLEEVDNLAWRKHSSGFPELLGYSGLFEALQVTANKLGFPFPDVLYSKQHQFVFTISNDVYGVLIALSKDESRYIIDLKIKENEKFFTMAVGLNRLKKLQLF